MIYKLLKLDALVKLLNYGMNSSEKKEKMQEMSTDVRARVKDAMHDVLDNAMPARLGLAGVRHKGHTARKVPGVQQI